MYQHIYLGLFSANEKKITFDTYNFKGGFLTLDRFESRGERTNTWIDSCTCCVHVTARQINNRWTKQTIELRHFGFNEPLNEHCNGISSTCLSTVNWIREWRDEVSTFALCAFFSFFPENETVRCERPQFGGVLKIIQYYSRGIKASQCKTINW